MRWFLVIVLFVVAIAAGTAPFWWEMLGGTLPERLSLLATWISAVAGLLGVAVAVIGYFAKGKSNERPQPTMQTVEGSIVNGHVSTKGDFAGGDMNKITLSQGKSNKRS